jgi:hypothetical protein
MVTFQSSNCHPLGVPVRISFSRPECGPQPYPHFCPNWRPKSRSIAGPNDGPIDTAHSLAYYSPYIVDRGTFNEPYISKPHGFPHKLTHECPNARADSRTDVLPNLQPLKLSNWQSYKMLGGEGQIRL